MAFTNSTSKEIRSNSRVIQREDGTLPETLYDLLAQATPRRHEYLLHPILEKALGAKLWEEDSHGNLIVDIGEPGKDTRTLFLSHLDTVHNNPDQLTLHYSTGNAKYTGFVYATNATHNYKLKWKGDTVEKKEFLAAMDVWLDSVAQDGRKVKMKQQDITFVDFTTTFRDSVLGADDKLGVYAMITMINEGVPGRYVFHVGEESGCIGSRNYVKDNKEFLQKNFDRAISFDRMGTDDIIAHQRGGRCASSEFSGELANQLNKLIGLPANRYKGDVQGSYTDSAEYKDIIPECTNISVGYYSQHSSSEHFDSVFYLNHLLPALAKLEWEHLPVERDPSKKEYGSVTRFQNGGYYGTFNGHKNSTPWNKPGATTLPANHVQYSPKTVSLMTPLVNTPKWDPEKDPFVTEASNEGLTRMVQKFIQEAESNQQIAKDIVQHVIMPYQDAVHETDTLRGVLTEICGTLSDIETRLIRGDATLEDIKDMITTLYQDIDKPDGHEVWTEQGWTQAMM